MNIHDGATTLHSSDIFTHGKGNANNNIITYVNTSGIGDQPSPALTSTGASDYSLTTSAEANPSTQPLHHSRVTNHHRFDGINSLAGGDLNIDDANHRSTEKSDNVSASSAATKPQKGQGSANNSDSDSDGEARQHTRLPIGDVLEDEDQRRSTLVQALAALEPQDLKVMRYIQRNKKNLWLRVLLYTTPIAGQMFFAADILKSWFNASAVRRVRRAMEAYDNYFNPVKDRIRGLVTEENIRYALSSHGAQDIERNADQPTSIETIVFDKIRNYANSSVVFGGDASMVLDKIVEEMVDANSPRNYRHNNRLRRRRRIYEREEDLQSNGFSRIDVDRVLKALLADGNDRRRDALLNRISAAYISKQVMSKDGYRSIEKLGLLSKVAHSWSRANPFMKTRLVESDSAIQVTQAAKEFGGNFLNSAKTVALNTAAELSSQLRGQVGKVADDLGQAVQSSVSAAIKP